MIPTSSFSSTSSSSSAASAIVRVEKATSDFLIGPDWTLNINICDAINTNPGMAKDVVKAVKKRLQHKNPKVQLLSLTLLETMVKNCGDYVHFQITERNILQDMVKIVKKKIDMHVRDKILVLLNSWQEAFGGPGGKYPQYYWAYEELRRCGVEFPQRTAEAAPMFTAAVTQPPMRHTQPGYGMPSNSSRRLDEAMASEVETLSFSTIHSMRDVLDLLSDMLQAVNPNDRAGVKDEVIIDLVEQCRSNQKKLMHMLTTTGDEELLGQGLDLNDSMQSVLAKHDAFASGSPLPAQITNFSPRSAEVEESTPSPMAIPSAPVVPESKQQVKEVKDEDDDDDDFALLARRHSKMQSPTSQDTNGTFSSTSSPFATPSNALALALPDPPPPVKTSNDQDMIDFLSLTLSTTTSTSPRPTTPPTPTQTHFSPPTQGYPHTHPTNQGHVPSDPYVVPWAQSQSQPQPQQFQPQPRPQTKQYIQPQQFRPQPQFQPQPQPQTQQFQPQPQPQTQQYIQPQQFQPQPQPQPQQYIQPQQFQPQPHSQPQQFQPQNRPNPQLSYGYPPPPWAGIPSYYNNPTPNLNPNPNPNPYAVSTPRANTPTYNRPLQQVNPFPVRGINGQPINGPVVPTGASAPTGNGQKPFVPSYRLFEDLNVLGNGDGRSGGLSGASSGQSMVGGRK